MPAPLTHRVSIRSLQCISLTRPSLGHYDTSNLRSKARSLREPLVLWVFTSIFTVIYSTAVHHVLLEGNPRIGSILLSATDTNYIVSVLSQFFATVVVRTLEAALDSLRWALAARAQGLSFANFMQLSGATDLFVVVMIMLWSRLRSCSGIIRLLFPVGSLFFGSILKFKADFESYFIPISNQIPVFAGLMPIDTRVLSIVPTAYMCLYFAGWIPSLLGNPKYAMAVSGDESGCYLDKNCTSIFLPVGLEIARKVRPILIATILEGGEFNDAEAIRVNNAPGMLLRFDRLERFPFDPDKDCSYYGEVINDTIQICIADRNTSIAVGWAACPTPLQTKNLCNASPSWKRDFNHTVLLSVSRRSATTTYSRRDLQIRKVVFPSGPTQPIPLSRSQFQPIWGKMLRFHNSSTETETDRIQTRSLAYSLAWLLRLYADVFPDDPFTPLAHLQNFLAIPLQFSTVCSQFANYTVPGDLFAGVFAMDPEMLTTAESGREADRLVSQAWTVWAFIGGSVAAMVGAGSLLAYMLCLEKPLPKGTGIPGVDILALTRRESEKTTGMKNAGQRIGDLESEVLGSARKMTVKLRGTRLKLVGGEGSCPRSVLTASGREDRDSGA